MGRGVVLHQTYLEVGGLQEYTKLSFWAEPDILACGDASSLRARQRLAFFEGQPELSTRAQEITHHAQEPPLVLEGEHRLVQEDGIEGGGIYRRTEDVRDDESRTVV